jgi:hypothetical protein
MYCRAEYNRFRGGYMRKQYCKWQSLLLLAVLLIAVRSFAQSVDALSGSVLFLYKEEQRPVLDDNKKPVVKDGKEVTETHTEYGTGFLVTPDNNLMFLVTAEHVACIIKSDFRAIIHGDNDTPFDCLQRRTNWQQGCCLDFSRKRRHRGYASAPSRQGSV